MFSRVVAVRTKEGKARQLAKTIHEKILPMLEGQNGFVSQRCDLLLGGVESSKSEHDTG